MILVHIDEQYNKQSLATLDLHIKSTVKNVGLFKRILLSSLCCLFYSLVPQILCSKDLGTLASQAYLKFILMPSLLRILNNLVEVFSFRH